ncbi:MAG: hypothetical protein WCE48_02465 [Steroidobacteraceae bacterium]
MSDLEIDEPFRTALRHLSQLDGSEPPAELDRLVIGRARHAIELSGHRWSPRGWRWAMPAGLAATAVIATLLAVFAGLPKSARIRPMNDALPVPPQAASREITDGSGTATALETRASGPPPAEPAAAPAATSPAAPVAVPSLRREQSAPANNLSPAAERDSPGVATTAATASGSVAAAPPASESRPQAAAKSMPAAVQARRAMEAAPPTDVRPGAADELAPRDPAKWLEEIRRLRAAGRSAAADREWAAFRKAWPDYPIDPGAPGR